MRTRVVSLAAAIALIPLVGLATASPASAAAPIADVTVTPSDVPVGTATTVIVEASWLATDTNPTDTVFTMPQALLDAGATWSSAALSLNQSGPCDLGSQPTPREAACLWRATVAGEITTMEAELQLPASVAAGTYIIEALAAGETTPARTGFLIVSAPSTASPTPSPTPSPSASTSSSPVPTAVPAGEGPSSGSGGLPLLPLVVVLAVVGGGAWVLVRSRA